MSTGVFNESMKQFFSAAEGAFTTFTRVELEKGTYNVKAVIRDMLIQHIGKENIPKANVPPNRPIRFRVCPKSRIAAGDSLYLQCKFSKPDKNEMTIYFTREELTRVKVEEEDYWYIYFAAGSDIPVIGILKKYVWEDLFAIESESVNLTVDQQEYSIPVTKLNITKEAPPVSLRVVSGGMNERKSMTPEETAEIERDRKVKGNRGEEIALEIEKQRLIKMGRADLIKKIIPIAKNRDGLGYDLVSTDIDSEGNEYDIFIEVKATSGDKESPFFITKRELEVSKKRRGYYYLYRIYELKRDSDTVKYYVAKGAIDENFKLIPTEFITQK